MAQSLISKHYAPLGDLDRFEARDDRVLLYAGDAVAEVRAKNEHVLRIRCAHGALADDRSFAVVEPGWAPLQLKETAETLELSTPSLLLVVRRNPLRLAFFESNGDLLNRDHPHRGMGFDRGRGIVCKSILDDERHFGFGEKTGGLNKRGTRMAMWNTDMPYTVKWDPLYASVPWMMVTRPGRCYGLFFDNPAKCFFDLGDSDAWSSTYRVEAGEIVYYVIRGPRPAQVVERFTALTGRMPMPPLWSLGHHQSRWGYKDETEIRRLAETFLAKNIPTDAIHLDIHWMRGYRVFEFHPRRFAEPKKLAADVGKQGFRLVTIVDPGVKKDPDWDTYLQGRDQGYFCQREGGGEFRARVWPGASAFPDFVQPQVRDWWAGLHRKLVENGISGVWNDMNDPSCWTLDVRTKNMVLALRPLRHPRMVHREGERTVAHLERRNVYGHLMCQASRQGLEQARPGERPFVLTRSGYAGTQRFAALWTGDNSSTFSHLALSLPMLLNLGLSGMPFVGPDIGGFMWNCSPELYARWVQLGAFYPFCRTHCAYGMKRQEPWSFGPEVEAIARDYLALRYRLIPSLYGLFRTAHETGLPVWRPLFLEFPDDPPSAEIEDQVMVGSSLLLAPVLDKGWESRWVYLPPGGWTDYWTGERQQGPATISRETPLALLPIYVREGATLFWQPPTRRLEGFKPDRITLDIFPAEHESASVLYEDDGLSPAYQEGAWRKTEVRHRRAGGEFFLDLAAPQGNYQPAPRSWEIVVRQLGPVRQVWLDGAELPPERWSWAETENRFRLELPDDGRARQIRIAGEHRR